MSLLLWDLVCASGWLSSLKCSGFTSCTMLIPTLLPSCCTGLHIAVIIDIRSNSSNPSVSCQLSLAHIHFGFDNAGLTVSGSLPSLSQPLTLFHSQLFSRLPMCLTHPRLQVYKTYSDQMLNIGVRLGVFSIHQQLLPVIQSQVHFVVLPLKSNYCPWALLSSTVLLHLGHRSIQYSLSQYP